jgi:beta-lactamase regulating signal transducer with metallopeptidase domain
MSAGTLLDLFVSNMVWASAAMLLVLAIRRPFAALFGAGPAYALWLLPTLRLVAPPLPGWSAVALPSLIPPQTVILIAEDVAAPVPPDGGPGQWVSILLAAWAAGAAAFILWQIWTYRRFLRGVERDARSLGMHRGVGLVESAAVEGPLSFGLLRRRIVVPSDFEHRYSAEERALALDHEAVHHRRLDLWWNHLGLLILALNWFNPVAWLAFRAFRADQELACDAAVAAKADPGARHDYACALVKSASRPGLIAACPLNHADQLKRRLRMMKFHRPGRLRMFGGAAAIAVLGGLSLALGSPGAVAQPSAPTPPNPPAASGHDDGDHDRTRVIVRTLRTDDRRDDEHVTRSERRDGDGPARREDRHITIITSNGDGPHAGTTDVRGPGDVHTMIATSDCPDQAGRSEVNEGDERTRTRIIVCSSGARSPAQRVESLQRARDRLAADDGVPAEHRQRVTAAIDREIARLRAAQ